MMDELLSCHKVQGTARTRRTGGLLSGWSFSGVGIFSGLLSGGLLSVIHWEGVDDDDDGRITIVS